MKPAPRIILSLLVLTGWAAAEVPETPAVTKYRNLWTDSPFTSKPPPVESGPAENPIGDYALLGVSPIPSGYRVTIVEKKNPEERIVLESDKPKEGFKILAVIRKAGDPLGTTVRLATGAMTGTVAFEDKLLEIKAPPPQQAAAKAPPGIPGQPQPAVPGQSPQRQPRPRVVPPPAPNQTPQQGGAAQPAPQRPQLRRR
ncbi:MAG: hypothetical protein H7A48_03040 [Akkermansiaceae bacterium]|nr:hypothetical protein [Akkermansiaceae bacterium]